MRYLDLLYNGQWGKLMEALIEGDLIKLLKKQGIKVTETSTNIKGTYNGKAAEFDIIARNGQEVVIVEVKTSLTQADVDYFIKKLKSFKKWKPDYKDKKIYGAITFLKKQQGVDKYAERRGLFVIRAVGSSSSIINKENFKPKVFE